eukprot:jgi/Picsp_1/6113/NSC_03467-R1_---NA---
MEAFEEPVLLSRMSHPTAQSFDGFDKLVPGRFLGDLDENKALFVGVNGRCVQMMCIECTYSSKNAPLRHNARQNSDFSNSDDEEDDIEIPISPMTSDEEDRSASLGPNRFVQDMKKPASVRACPVSDAIHIACEDGCCSDADFKYHTIVEIVAVNERALFRSAHDARGEDVVLSEQAKGLSSCKASRDVCLVQLGCGTLVILEYESRKFNILWKGNIFDSKSSATMYTQGSRKRHGSLLVDKPDLVYAVDVAFPFIVMLTKSTEFYIVRFMMSRDGNYGSTSLGNTNDWDGVSLCVEGKYLLPFDTSIHKNIQSCEIGEDLPALKALYHAECYEDSNSKSADRNDPPFEKLQTQKSTQSQHKRVPAILAYCKVRRRSEKDYLYDNPHKCFSVNLPLRTGYNVRICDKHKAFHFEKSSYSDVADPGGPSLLFSFRDFSDKRFTFCEESFEYDLPPNLLKEKIFKKPNHGYPEACRLLHIRHASDGLVYPHAAFIDKGYRMVLFSLDHHTKWRIKVDECLNLLTDEEFAEVDLERSRQRAKSRPHDMSRDVGTNWVYIIDCCSFPDINQVALVLSDKRFLLCHTFTDNDNLYLQHLHISLKIKCMENACTLRFSNAEFASSCNPWSNGNIGSYILNGQGYIFPSAPGVERSFYESILCFCDDFLDFSLGYLKAARVSKVLAQLGVVALYYQPALAIITKDPIPLCLCRTTPDYIMGCSNIWNIQDATHGYDIYLIFTSPAGTRALEVRKSGFYDITKDLMSLEKQKLTLFCGQIDSMIVQVTESSVIAFHINHNAGSARLDIDPTERIISATLGTILIIQKVNSQGDFYISILSIQSSDKKWKISINPEISLKISRELTCFSNIIRNSSRRDPFYICLAGVRKSEEVYILCVHQEMATKLLTLKVSSHFLFTQSQLNEEPNWQGSKHSDIASLCFQYLDPENANLFQVIGCDRNGLVHCRSIEIHATDKDVKICTISGCRSTKVGNIAAVLYPLTGKYRDNFLIYDFLAVSDKDISLVQCCKGGLVVSYLQVGRMKCGIPFRVHQSAAIHGERDLMACVSDSNEMLVFSLNSLSWSSCFTYAIPDLIPINVSSWLSTPNVCVVHAFGPDTSFLVLMNLETMAKVTHELPQEENDAFYLSIVHSMHLLDDSPLGYLSKGVLGRSVDMDTLNQHNEEVTKFVVLFSNNAGGLESGFRQKCAIWSATISPEGWVSLLPSYDLQLPCQIHNSSFIDHKHLSKNREDSSTGSHCVMLSRKGLIHIDNMGIGHISRLDESLHTLQEVENYAGNRPQIIVGSQHHLSYLYQDHQFNIVYVLLSARLHGLVQ